jgi:hypothetical protein
MYTTAALQASVDPLLGRQTTQAYTETATLSRYNEKNLK